MARILIVDDDRQIRDMLRATLEREGFEVAEAADGRQALALYRQTPADVVLADIIMPEMEGIETILQLRKVDPGARIIAMSGGGHIGPHAYLSSAQQCGAQFVFTKPIDREELLGAIQELVA
jgi:DNA-binding NtrC family response regulator